MSRRHEPERGQRQSSVNFARPCILEEHEVSQGHECQEVRQQLRQDATVHKAVDRGVAEDAAFGQEGGIEHQQERQDAEVHCGEQGRRLFSVAVDEQEVRRGDKDHPRDQ